MVDRAYTPGPCSRLSDVIGPPIIGPIPIGMLARNPCGKPADGQRRIILEFVLPFCDYFDCYDMHLKIVVGTVGIRSPFKR